MRIRQRYDIKGRVQGVGFRPSVYRLATELGLTGIVGNDSQGAFIEIEGAKDDVEHFARRLPESLPVRARVTGTTISKLPCAHATGFQIVNSEKLSEQEAEISPDIATCPDCLREMCDPADRRFGYPFINCTNCGPRYSIVKDIPYDRCQTTMHVFQMCDACQAEYDNPLDRRFHAQPNACHDCGPQVWYEDLEGNRTERDAIKICADALRNGRILAIKGLGGFHLACRADLDETVALLRERKGREAKPFALMAADFEIACTLAKFQKSARAMLGDWRSPIVLGRKQPDAPISDAVAPGCATLGIMLPYTPLHHLLFKEGLGPLVMTSANPSDEPLCTVNKEARKRLSHIADGFLLHDRDIERGVDDSLLTAVSAGQRELLVPIRRSRGFTPEPLVLPYSSPIPILALGGDLKSAVSMISGDQAVQSEHLGELSNPASFRNFVAAIDRLRRILKQDPKLIACDLHPGYHSSRHAQTLGVRTIPVQHHHAHVESCKAENGLTGPVIGLAADGTGYGTDGAIWGCELLLSNGPDFVRLGHLRYFSLIGGDSAARDTWRPAIGLLHETYGPDWQEVVTLDTTAIPAPALKLMRNRMGSGATPLTSSLGRLFDGVAFLIGACTRNRFEADAPMTLEAMAIEHGPEAPLTYQIMETESGIQWDFAPMIRELVAARQGGASTPELASRFHATLVAMFRDAIVSICQQHGHQKVALSGGCFLNSLLLGNLYQDLASSGITPYIHGSVPTGDGGLALGQAVIAAQHELRGL